MFAAYKKCRTKGFCGWIIYCERKIGMEKKENKRIRDRQNETQRERRNGRKKELEREWKKKVKETDIDREQICLMLWI